MDFAEAKTTLMRSENGTSVYDHLQELILKIVTEKPDEGVALFEQLSRAAKRQQYKAKAPENAQNGRDAISAEANATSLKVNAALSKLLVSDEDEAEASGSIQDVVTDLEALAYCGVNLGDTQRFKLFASMRSLAAQLSSSGDLQSLRFWGVMLGTSGDYFVCQGQYRSEDDDDVEDSQNLEIGPNSPNKFTYWVSSSPADEWTRLPNVTAAQIVAARQIRRFLTGKLESPVKGHPPFPGTEKEYLRAQIAQITAECSVSPDGFFKQSEDEFLMVPNEEMEPSESVEELKSTDAWRHHHLDIDASGRCVPFPEEDEDGATKDVDEPEMLKSLDEDSWAVRAPVRSKVCLRSRKWEGAHAVAFGNNFAWIYVGYGQRTDDSSISYTPVPPSMPQDEFDASDIKEADDVLADPNPEEDSAEKAEEEDDE